jgi:hypothetical protein
MSKLMFMFISMGWDDVSELRRQASLLFISQLIHDYEEPWRSDIDRQTEDVGEKSVPVPLCLP